MRDIANVFFLSAVLCVTAGMVLGLWMGPTGNFQFAPVHAHLNLLGWVTMALFAIYYRLTPRAAQGRLPRVHAALAIPGVLLMSGGLAVEIAGRPEGFPVIVLGAFLSFGSMLIFLFTVLRYGFGVAQASGHGARLGAAIGAV
ncbi:hypothetical protein [Rubellimicrobium aerolatum]|uniref:Cbb3-type cytochrome c oxidase subunit I n=1 Tax=Rubellimicrobium aerolatum TaxID=490979 RepID=A0ABW0S916_9RHOB|nr:hypothetical protein [Rubellimicrobium aerolatum]MBP1804775.1 ABC-type uncharacterized transport system permease subunit [Rubellimicrobium aerolatum]